MIKVVQLQYFSESTGRAVLRLHRAFLSNGIESTIISLKQGLNDDEKIIQKKGKISKLKALADRKLQSWLMRNNLKEFGAFSYPVFGTDVSHMKEVQNADYIYIHWALGGFLNLSDFEKLAKLAKPVFFFMHDMWNITGGCHHSFTCEKYKSHCFDCQVFPKHKMKDLSFKGFEKKLNLYSKYNNLYFISPSKWLYECAKQSPLTKDKPLFHIPNILEDIFFKPFDKTIAKRNLNLNPNETVIAFGANSIDSPYKGWDYLLKALKILALEVEFKKISVVIFGSGYKKEIANEIPFQTIFTGYLRDEYSPMLIYNAADVFIAPSIADNLPTTVLESLRCGTPVVGFDVGGIPDMIKHKKNGYIAKYKNASDVVEGIKFCINSKIKGYTLPEFETNHILDQHKNLFDQVLSLQNLNNRTD
jgi:glycosyltransferase involved in cell wall biosynthesis